VPGARCPGFIAARALRQYRDAIRELRVNVREILNILKGDPEIKSDQGLIGEFSEVKRTLLLHSLVLKLTAAILTLIGIPLLVHFLSSR